jgi:hypothetical protein
MELEEFIKYVVWIILFGVLLTGVYFALKRIGIA